MKKAFRILSLALALLLCLAATALGEGTIAAEPITIRIFAPKGADVAPYETMDYLNEYMALTGVNVEWEQVDSGQQDERFNVVLASGDLPDMFWNLNQSVYQAIRSAGAVAPLQDYINAENTPNLIAITEQFPSTVPEFTEPDGSIYFLPLFDGLAANNPTILRLDWLEQLGLELPVTLDDWYAYWIGVRDNDMNGNGDATDEIPLSVTGSVQNAGIRSWVSAFDMLDRFYVDMNGDGKIHFANIDPRYKEFLTWANGLYNDGILDIEFASMNTDNFRTKNAQNLVGSYRGALNSALNTFMMTMPANIEGYSLMATEPPMSATGEQLHNGCANLVRQNLIGGVVTVTSEYKEECVRFCDWFYDFSDPDGGGFQNIFGEEGVTFEYNEDKSDYFYTDYVMNNPDGLSAQQALMRYTTRGQHPAYVNEKGSFKMWNENTVAAYANIEPFYTDSLPFVLPTLPLTDAQNQTIRRIMADVDTYVDEMVYKFILGQEPLDAFDAYVQAVENMGIQEALDIYNEALDVYNANR